MIGPIPIAQRMERLLSRVPYRDPIMFVSRRTTPEATCVLSIIMHLWGSPAIDILDILSRYQWLVGRYAEGDCRLLGVRVIAFDFP